MATAQALRSVGELATERLLKITRAAQAAQKLGKQACVLSRDVVARVCLVECATHQGVCVHLSMAQGTRGWGVSAGCRRAAQRAAAATKDTHSRWGEW
jgi:hypothetical protein